MDQNTSGTASLLDGLCAVLRGHGKEADALERGALEVRVRRSTLTERLIAEAQGIRARHDLLTDELRAYHASSVDCGRPETACDLAAILRLVGVDVAVSL